MDWIHPVQSSSLQVAERGIAFQQVQRDVTRAAIN